MMIVDPSDSPLEIFGVQLPEKITWRDFTRASLRIILTLSRRSLVSEDGNLSVFW